MENVSSTPTVDTETVQRLFIQAYNRMMENREQIIKDCETMRRALTDFAELDAEIEQQLEETQVRWSRRMLPRRSPRRLI